jgi:hypothetical protein
MHAELHTKTCEQRGRTEDIDGNGIGLRGACRRVDWIGEVRPSDCVRAALRPG